MEIPGTNGSAEIAILIENKPVGRFLSTGFEYSINDINQKTKSSCKRKYICNTTKNLEN